MLRLAQEVTVLAIGEPGADHLHGAGIATTVQQDFDSRTGDVDLLVMGAYGHSRLRELVLGGATQKALSAADVPLLMSH